jgi:hypothetical protein
VLSWACRQEAERAYLLSKARHVAEQRGRGFVAVEEAGGTQQGKALVDFVVHGLKAELFPELIELMGWPGACLDQADSC